MTHPLALTGPWRVSLIDRWELRQGDRRVLAPSRVQRLIAVLALQGEQPRSVVAASLWPTSDEGRARSSLRAAALHARRVAPGVLTAADGSLGLDASVCVDFHTARRTLEAARAEPTVDVVRAVSGWGELLPGWYEDWVLTERERWRRRRMSALDLMADRALAEGDLGVALAAAEACVALEPLREASHRVLAQVHLAMGNRIEALTVYERFRRRSLVEFGLAPDPRFEQLIAPLRLERRSRRAPAGVPSRSTP